MLTTKRDTLDEQLYFGIGTAASNDNALRWNSSACICPSSGTILHFLSLAKGIEVAESGYESNGSIERENTDASLSLIAVHGGTASQTLVDATTKNSTQQYCNALFECRDRLAKVMVDNNATTFTTESKARGLLLYAMLSLGRQPSPSLLFGKASSASTILNFTPFTSDQNNKHQTEVFATDDVLSDKCKLRELALPFFPESSSLHHQLFQSALSRPLPGLYQCAHNSNQNAHHSARRNTTTDPGLIIRPLPTATEDFRLPPPSLVFQCPSLTDAQALVEDTLGGQTAKIGWRGDGQCGSLIVNHPSIHGMDVRLCEVRESSNEWALSSSFDEAQESLLAGSLDELQSTLVMSDGKGSDDESTVEVDPKTNSADCWVEVRSNVKHPTGYRKQLYTWLRNRVTGKNGDRVSVAKPPHLPFE